MTVQAKNRARAHDVLRSKVDPEATLQAQVLQLAKARGVLAYHTHDSRRSPAGFPDTVLAGPGGVAFLELKRAKGSRTSPAQRQWITTLRASGAVAAICKPEHLPWIIEVVRALATDPEDSVVADRLYYLMEAAP